MIDINVWLALTWDRHPQHVPASHSYGSIDGDAFLFCLLTRLGFLHLLTNQQVMGDSTTIMEPRGAETLFRRAVLPFAKQPATKAIADLIGFAEAAGAHVVTFDQGLAAPAQFRQVPVALLAPAEKAGPGVSQTRRKRRNRRSE